MTDLLNELRMSKEEIDKVLANTDWQKYWKDVAEAADPEIEAYRIASAKSMKTTKVLV